MAFCLLSWFDLLFETSSAYSELLEFWTLSGVLETRKHNVSETGSVSILRWEEKTPTQLGPLERPNLNHWTQWVGVFPPSSEDGNRSIIRNVVFSSF
jgi:hypothetical protein